MPLAVPSKTRSRREIPPCEDVPDVAQRCAPVEMKASRSPCDTSRNHAVWCQVVPLTCTIA